MARKTSTGARAALGELEIIARYFAPLAKDTPGAFGLIDDAALLTPPEGRELVLTADMLIAGVHFRDGDRPEDIAWKALAVNVSDLVAKGAEPLVYLLTLALPKTPDPEWLQGLTEGFAAAQDAFGCRLAGGDTTATPGPISLSITAAGHVPAGGMVRREGAKVEDAIYVTGTIGDGALGLALLREPKCGGLWDLDAAQETSLRQRYWQPAPPTALSIVLRDYATAAMDISDGLVGDLRKLCLASHAGAEIVAADVPLSQAARAALERDPRLLELVLTGGDDYEVLATIPMNRRGDFEADARAAAVSVTQIGRVVSGEGVTVLSARGKPMRFARDSYDHF